MADAVVTVAEVKAFKTQSGYTRFVLRDAEGREYTTFREQIARDAVAAEGRRARITFHEQQRGNFTNVYLDAVEALEDAAEEGSEAVEEVAWKTAVDAAPWLLGGEPEEAFRRRSSSSGCSPSRSASPTTSAATHRTRRTSGSYA